MIESADRERDVNVKRPFNQKQNKDDMGIYVKIQYLEATIDSRHFLVW